jgi:hypothetical protein
MAKLTRKPKEIFKTVRIKGSYEGFNEFYRKNQEIILEGIIDVFNEFKKTDKKKLTFLIKVNLSIEDGETLWDSEFTFTRKDYPVLVKEVIPFYEEKENYEKCLEIMNLYNDFTKGKKIPILE